MKIIVDAMGGDNAPVSNVRGALAAVRELGVEVILVGRGEDILKVLKEDGIGELPPGLEIVHASEVVEMCDNPATAFKEKKDSSLTVGLNLLKNGDGAAFVSAGSTGPLAVICWNGFDWEKHEIEVSVNVNVDINDYIDLSNYAKLTADNEFVGNQKIIGSLETGETRGKLRPVANRNRKMTDGEAVVWDALLQVIKTVKQVPDTVLWDGKTFPDWFDQALRTTDSPEFVALLANYLKSKDFASGLTGYKVGVDTEVETLKVRRFLEVVEYLVNQISLIGDEVILTEVHLH